MNHRGPAEAAARSAALDRAIRFSRGRYRDRGVSCLSAQVLSCRIWSRQGESSRQARAESRPGLAAHRILAGETIEAAEAAELAAAFSPTANWAGARRRRLAIEREFDFLLNVETSCCEGRSICGSKNRAS